MTPRKFYKLFKDLAARRDLRPADKLVYAVLADHVGGNADAWPGCRRLARLGGIARSTVLDSITRLEQLGLVEVARQENGKTNRYRLTGMNTLPVQGDETGMNTLPVGKTDRSEYATTTGLNTLPEPVGYSDQNETDLLNETGETDNTGAAAPPGGEEGDEDQTEGQASEPFQLEPPPNTPQRQSKKNVSPAAGLVAAWIDGHRQATGRDYPGRARGKLAGIVKRLLADHGEAELAGAVERWFADGRRKDYGVEILERRLAGGDSELLPRDPAQAMTAAERAEVEATRRLMESSGKPSRRAGGVA